MKPPSWIKEQGAWAEPKQNMALKRGGGSVSSLSFSTSIVDSCFHSSCGLLRGFWWSWKFYFFIYPPNNSTLPSSWSQKGSATGGTRGVSDFFVFSAVLFLAYSNCPYCVPRLAQMVPQIAVSTAPDFRKCQPTPLL